MNIKTVLGDITQIAADAIVNAANERMLGGGGSFYGSDGGYGGRATEGDGGFFGLFSALFG